MSEKGCDDHESTCCKTGPVLDLARAPGSSLPEPWYGRHALPDRARIAHRATDELADAPAYPDAYAAAPAQPHAHGDKGRGNARPADGGLHVDDPAHRTGVR